MKIFAHRGFSYPENTIFAFQNALEFGINGIELDVYLTKDKKIVVFHDKTLKRMTGLNGEIEQLTLAEIQKIKINNIHSIPTLEEVLDLVNRKCVVNIELKGQNTAKQTLEIIQKYINLHNWNYDDFLVSSFDWQQIMRTKRINTKVNLAILEEHNVQKAMNFAIKNNIKTINFYYKIVNQDVLKKTEKYELKIFVWTINDLKIIQDFMKMNIEGIITDKIDLLSSFITL